MKIINKNRQEKGITLIALVITIVVLLILAGVSIATLTGDNGIITNVIKARKESDIADEKEKISIAYSGLYIRKDIKEISEITPENLKNELIKNGENENNIQVYYSNLLFRDTENEYTITYGGNYNVEDTIHVKSHMKTYLYKEYDEGSNTYKIRMCGRIPSRNFDGIKIIFSYFGRTREFDTNGVLGRVESGGYTLTPKMLGTNELVAYSLNGVPNDNDLFNDGNGFECKYRLKSCITGDWIESESVKIFQLNEIKNWGEW